MGHASRDDLEGLYRVRHVAFRNALVGVAGSVPGGDDAMQEGFALALRSLHQFRGEGSLEAWVWRICLNEALGIRRRLRDEKRGDFAEVEASELLPKWEEDRDLLDAIGRLTPRRRLVVFLRYFADMSYEEIAAATGMRGGTVAATLARARDDLARQLTQEETAK